MHDRAEITVTVLGDGTYSEAELADRAELLLRELDAVSGVTAIRPPGAAPEAGQKGDFLTVTDVLLQISAAVLGGAVPPVIATMKDWINRQPEGLRLEIKPQGEKTGFSISGQLDQLDPKALAEAIVQSLGAKAAKG